MDISSVWTWVQYSSYNIFGDETKHFVSLPLLTRKELYLKISPSLLSSLCLRMLSRVENSFSAAVWCCLLGWSRLDVNKYNVSILTLLLGTNKDFRIFFYMCPMGSVRHINSGLSPALTKSTVSDMHDCRSGNNHFTQLEHWQHWLWKLLNLSLLLVRSSSSTGAHQCVGWHTWGQAKVDAPTHPFCLTNTHTEAQGHKVSAGASALWFLLSKGCKMEIRLNGWHGFHYPWHVLYKVVATYWYW